MLKHFIDRKHKKAILAFIVFQTITTLALILSLVNFRGSLHTGAQAAIRGGRNSDLQGMLGAGGPTTLNPALSDGGPQAGWTEQTDTGLYLVTQLKNGFYWKTVYTTDGRDNWREQGYLDKDPFWQSAQSVNVNGINVLPTTDNGPQAAWSEKRSSGWVTTIVNQGAYWEIKRVNDATYSWGNKGLTSALFAGAPAVGGITPYTNNGPKSALEEEVPGGWQVTFVNEGKFWKAKYKNGAVTWLTSGNLSNHTFATGTPPTVEGAYLLEGGGPDAAWGYKKTNGQWISTAANDGAYWTIERTYAGNMQDLNTYMLPNNTVAKQSYWRGNIGFGRDIPIVNGQIQWTQAHYWGDPVAISGLPGQGDLQAFHSFILPNGAALNQTIWRNNQGFTRNVPIVNGQIDFGSTPNWNGPISADAAVVEGGLPGDGPVQATNAFIQPNGSTLKQSVWRNNQGYVRDLPIVNGQVNLNSNISWSSPISLNGLPGSGDMQAFNAFIHPDGSALRQSIIRNNQGYTRDVPVINGQLDFNQAGVWSAPLSFDDLPGTPSYTWSNRAGVVTEPITGLNSNGRYHWETHNRYFTDWEFSNAESYAFTTHRYVPIIWGNDAGDFPCAKPGEPICTPEQVEEWADLLVQKVVNEPRFRSRTWMVFSEPNNPDSGNLDPLEGAKMYDVFYDKMKALDPDARFYCCGIIEAAGPTSSHYQNWFNTFSSNIHRPLDGIHYHGYAVIHGWMDSQAIINFWQEHFDYISSITTPIGQKLGELAHVDTEWSGLKPHDNPDLMCPDPQNPNQINNLEDVMRPVSAWINENARTINLVSSFWFTSWTPDFLSVSLYQASNSAELTCLGEEYEQYIWGEYPTSTDIPIVPPVDMSSKTR